MIWAALFYFYPIYLCIYFKAFPSAMNILFQTYFSSKGSIILAAPQGEFDVFHTCPLNSQISLHIALPHGAIYHVYAL